MRTVEVEGVELEIGDSTWEELWASRCTDETCPCVDGFSLRPTPEKGRS